MRLNCRVSHEAASPHVDAGSDVESDDDNEDGDYTVFECRGLATVSVQFSSVPNISAHVGLSALVVTVSDS